MCIMNRGGGVILTFSCESFVDYTYNGEEALEAIHPLRGIKERLRKICTSLYKKCNSIYESNKAKRPKVASVFKTFANFFKKHSTLVDRINTKEEVQREIDTIDKTHSRVVQAYRYIDIDGEAHEFDNEEDFNAFRRKKEDERQKAIKEGKERMAEREAQSKKLQEEQKKRIEAEHRLRQIQYDEDEKKAKKEHEERLAAKKEAEKWKKKKDAHIRDIRVRKSEDYADPRFEHLCETKNKNAVRDWLMYDLKENDKNFDASLNYVKKHFPEVFDEYESLKDDESNMITFKSDTKLNKDFLFFQLYDNFSIKRLRRVRAILKRL